MEKFTRAFFSFRSAYQFKNNKSLSLDHFLLEELIFQLQNLEERWLELDMEGWYEEYSLGQEIKFQLHIGGLCFRLEELLRFLKTSNGPGIIHFICSEILDFLREQKIMKAMIPQYQIKQVEQILTIMNSFFRADLSSLHLMNINEVSTLLEEATKQLLNRYSTKKEGSDHVQ